METNEIKPSFSLKYLLLTMITTGIVGVIGIGLSKLYESRPSQELTVINGYSINVIGGASLPKDKFEVEYYVKGDERIKISSLFRKKVIIQNTGSIGVSDLEVTAILKNEAVELIDYPKIESIPTNIVDAISITKNDKSTNKKHFWTVSLLNPDELISFDYSAFSIKQLDSISLEVIPRKKDLKINYEELKLSSGESTTYETIKSLLIGLMLLTSLTVAITYPIYLYQWNRRPDYRKYYGSFMRFYDEHSPWRLFKALDDSENKQSKSDT